MERNEPRSTSTVRVEVDSEKSLFLSMRTQEPREVAKKLKGRNKSSSSQDSSLDEANSRDDSQSKVIEVHFDGLCEPRNPGGVATYGVVIKMDGKKIFEECGLAEAKPWTNEASNNVAEYSALIRGLEWLKEHDLQRHKIVLLGDSKLVVNQLNGKFKVKAPRLVELYKRAMDLIATFKDIEVKWIDRSLNSDADLLSRIAYRKYLKSTAR